ncbi:DUF2975 domain-containing protein [Lacinutrix sp. WUR7]|uniref:DUF2975 domain-containing protein n=1 Tax=Lacinutrix sp. WUR7 TaxID=2653681 RepID=UPI00193DD36E|nr:DUF2975 domain-containing protein [Lacinutrix sp. WUR7]QRM88531.1 DUF2975 domain-containing protein [Lacinutrix sp. WUR7]
MKIKMFGKKSVSALLFWVFLFLLTLVVISTAMYIPNLIQDASSIMLLNLAPLVSYFALLIPLVFLFYAFKKRVLFTKQCIKYLYLFAVFNSLSLIFTWVTFVFFLGMEHIDMFSLSFPNILLITFALFLTSIFKQGFYVQQENELTI